MLKSSYIHWYECKDQEEALKNALQAQQLMDVDLIEATECTQGQRFNAVTSFSFQELMDRVELHAIKKDDIGLIDVETVQTAYNRPIEDGHVNNISKYLSENFYGKYVLPSISITATSQVTVFTYPSLIDKNKRKAFITISKNQKFAVTDGQHRVQGINYSKTMMQTNGEAEKLEQFMKQHIPVMISFETDMIQIHQDFADCARTLSLSKSIIAVYDSRQTFNNLVIKFTKNCPLFNRKLTDSTSKSLGSGTKAFTVTSSLRSFLKTIATGNASLSNNSFEKWCNANFDRHSLNNFEIKALQAISFLTKSNKTLTVIQNLEPNTTSRSIIPSIRHSSLIATPAGLNLAGKVIHEILFQKGLSEKHKECFIKKLGELNWDKDNTFWHDSIIKKTEGHTANPKDRMYYKYAVVSTNACISKAFNDICKEINLPLTTNKISLKDI